MDEKVLLNVEINATEALKDYAKLRIEIDTLQKSQKELKDAGQGSSQQYIEQAEKIKALSARARYGTKRSRCDRFGCCSRYPADYAGLILIVNHKKAVAQFVRQLFLWDSAYACWLCRILHTQILRAFRRKSNIQKTKNALESKLSDAFLLFCL